MANTDLSDYKSSYIDTSKENVEVILSKLSQLINDSSNNELIQEIHANAHSLKGKSQMMGYTEIANTSKSIEEMSDKILKNDLKLSEEIIFDLNKSASSLKEMIGNLGT